MSTKDTFLSILAGLGAFFGSLLVLMPLSTLLIGWFHDPPPGAPHGGGLALAGKLGFGIFIDLGLAAGVGCLVGYLLQQKWSATDAQKIVDARQPPRAWSPERHDADARRRTAR